MYRRLFDTFQPYAFGLIPDRESVLRPIGGRQSIARGSQTRAAPPPSTCIAGPMPQAHHPTRAPATPEKTQTHTLTLDWIVCSLLYFKL